MNRKCCSDKLVVSSLQNNLLSHCWWAHRGPVPPTLSWQSTQGRSTTTWWLHCGRPLWTRWTQRQCWSDEKQNHAVWQHQKHTQESFSDHNAGSTNRLFLADLGQVLHLLQLVLLTPLLLLLQQQWYSDFTVAVQTGYFWWCLLWHMASQQRPDVEEHLTAVAVGSGVKRRSSRETTSAAGLPGGTLVRS